MQAEATFGAMGSTAHLVVVGPDASRDLEWARTRLAQLESRWTRFSSNSEISRLNENAGHLMIVSADTYRLVEHAVAAWERTSGRFNPTLLHALETLGYDRTFPDIDQPAPTISTAVGGFTPGSVAAIDLYPELNAVILPTGTGLDPGGIGKGLAADMLTEELLARGASGAMVNLGGDIRASGTPPDGATGWTISVADPFDPDRELLRVEIPGGAVATSSRLQRQWSNTAGASMHHILDADTGQPIDNDIAAVTVVAGESWWAEALTKTVFAVGVVDGLDQLTNASGVIVDLDGNHHATPDLEAALR